MALDFPFIFICRQLYIYTGRYHKITLLIRVEVVNLQAVEHSMNHIMAISLVPRPSIAYNRHVVIASYPGH